MAVPTGSKLAEAKVHCSRSGEAAPVVAGISAAAAADKARGRVKGVPWGRAAEFIAPHSAGARPPAQGVTVKAEGKAGPQERARLPVCEGASAQVTRKDSMGEGGRGSVICAGAVSRA
jgi:hypothetical protein